LEIDVVDERKSKQCCGSQVENRLNESTDCEPRTKSHRGDGLLCLLYVNK